MPDWSPSYMVLHGIRPGPVPSLAGIRLADAQAATAVIEAKNNASETAGRHCFEVTVAASVLPRFYALALLRGPGNE